jgi:hypothetical protein
MTDRSIRRQSEFGIDIAVLLLLCGLSVMSTGCVPAAAIERPANPPVVPDFSAEDPSCKVKSVEKYPAEFENLGKLPGRDLYAFTYLDEKGVYQVYTSHAPRREGATCITCTARLNGPKVDRNKPMISWHPSGNWLIVGVERDNHELQWTPKTWQRGLLQSGMWLNVWVTTPTGDRWFQITDFKKTRTAPSDGFVGGFAPDGTKGVWAEIVDGNVLVNAFGAWKLFVSDFRVSPDGTPGFVNKRDITPPGARWVEPGGFAPDGRRLLISSDIGLKDARGQDQYSLDIRSGEVRNLTNTPNVWDEHGLYSRSGRKIVFMSSYPYRNEPDSHNIASLKTEFMLMDADGSHLQQLTHFNVPGYAESQRGRTVAAVAGFMDNPAQLFATVMTPDFGKSNWVITFEGPCDR